MITTDLWSLKTVFHKRNWIKLTCKLATVHLIRKKCFPVIENLGKYLLSSCVVVTNKSTHVYVLFFSAALCASRRYRDEWVSERHLCFANHSRGRGVALSPNACAVHVFFVRQICVVLEWVLQIEYKLIRILKCVQQ